MKNKKRLLIVGAYGSGEIAMSVFEDINKVTDEWQIEGYLNDVIVPGKYLGKHKVLDCSESIIDYVNKGYYIHYALHFNAKHKEERVNKLNAYQIPLEAHATGIHPLAYLNPTSKIGNGSLMAPFSSTSAKAIIGNCVHLYTNSFIGHDSVVQDFCTIAAHSIVGGRVIVEEGAHIGLNASIREDLIIGKYSILGMGSVLTKSISENEIWAGNPAHFLKKVK